jgi:predicted LPLAT superfamily acyltransferase
MCDVEIVAKKALSDVLFDVWHTAIIKQEGRNLESLEKQHHRVYWMIAKMCGTAYDAALLYPVSTYYFLPTAKAQLKRQAAIRRNLDEQADKRQTKTGRRLHRKAA